MLLSTPTTSCPQASKCATASDPTSPLLPVTRIFTRVPASYEECHNFGRLNPEITTGLRRRPEKRPPQRKLDLPGELARFGLRSRFTTLVWRSFRMVFAVCASRAALDLAGRTAASTTNQTSQQNRKHDTRSAFR
jgi:hypothetical protein